MKGICVTHNGFKINVEPFKRIIELRMASIQQSYSEPGAEKTETVVEKVIKRLVTLSDYREFKHGYKVGTEFMFADEMYTVKKVVKNLETSNDSNFDSTESLIIIAVSNDIY